MQKIINTAFCSIKIAMILVGIYAISIGVATFVENDYGSLAARVWVYDTFWFEILHLWLVFSLIGCFIASKSWKNKKYAALLLHLSFIIIIIGAGITRYFGFEGIMSLREGENQSSLITNERYIFIQAMNNKKEIQDIKIPTKIDDKINKSVDETIMFFDKPLHISTGEVSKEMGDYDKLNVRIEYINQSQDIKLLGAPNTPFTKELVQRLEFSNNNAKDLLDSTESNFFDNESYQFFIAWGADEVVLPFDIYLKSFSLDRYPGSASPMSYASLVEVRDEKTNKDPFEFLIFMNNVLDYGGYRFFQSSYHQDEKGSILSVNRDPGKIPTYIGYTLLIIACVWLLFDKGGRFKALSRFLNAQKFIGIAFTIGLLSLNSQMIAMPESSIESNSQTNDESNLQSAESNTNPIQITQEIINQHINSLKNAKDFAKAFDYILVQDFGGRTKPMHTLTNEYIHKITKKDSMFGLNPTQIFIGMLLFSEYWENIELIYTSTPKLREILGKDVNKKYISYRDVFTNDKRYILQNYVEEANLKKPALRSTFDKDVIAVDERINYIFLIASGQVLRIFPDAKAPNNQWLSPIEILAAAMAQQDKAKVEQIFNIFQKINKIQNGNWQDSIGVVDDIINYQQQNGGEQLISQAKLKSEIMLNTYNPFHQITLPYILLAIILFIIVLVSTLRNKPIRAITNKVFYALFILLFVLHTIGLIMRWYISGHAPWSNAYESMLYIAWSAIFAGVICFGKSNLALATSSFMAGMTLFVAHLGYMDPQIGNLVPVLKSYWLNIHVSVITASYGFLGLCFIIGVVTLLMFILRNKDESKNLQRNKNITNSILSLSAINEMSMILGLFLLTIGNFLGAIWANESWGRYWGWDAKETWALVSIGVYAIILHLRFMIKVNLPFIFASASVIGFFSILMTYFGVNYYLSGMHSYAAGDPLTIPAFVYVMIGALALLIILAGFKRHLQMPKLS